MHVRQHFEPFRAIEFGDEVGEGQLKILRMQMLWQPEVHVVPRERLAIALRGQLWVLPEMIQGVSRGNVERSVDVNQGAVEIEENRLEVTFQTNFRRRARAPAQSDVLRCPHD